MLCLDEKSAAIVVGVRAALLDQHVRHHCHTPRPAWTGEMVQSGSRVRFGSVLFGTARSADEVFRHHHEQAWENTRTSVRTIARGLWCNSKGPSSAAAPHGQRRRDWSV